MDGDNDFSVRIGIGSECLPRTASSPKGEDIAHDGEQFVIADISVAGRMAHLQRRLRRELFPIPFGPINGIDRAFPNIDADNRSVGAERYPSVPGDRRCPVAHTSDVTGVRRDRWSYRPPRDVLWRYSVLGVFTAVATSAACVELFAIDVGLRRVLITLITTLCVVAGVALPRPVLLSVGLVLLCVVPPGVFPEEFPRSVTPASVLVGIWVWRTMLQQRVFHRVRTAPRSDVMNRAAIGVMASFVLWCLLQTVFSVDVKVSVGWVTGMIVTIAAPVLLASRREARLVRQTWAVISVPLSLYVIAESMLESNVFFGSLPGVGDPQHWSVYRATAGFGHPLAAGTFFAVAFALLVGEAARRQGRNRVMALVSALLVVDALLCTVARGSLVAGLIALIVMAVAAAILERRRLRGFLRRSPVGNGRRAVTFGIATAAVGALGLALLVDRLGVLVERTTSAESAGSNSARVEGMDIALDGARASNWIGVGPGASQRAVDEFNTTDVPVENSYLQLVLSVGLPGALLFCVLIVLAATAALRRRDWGALGAVTALGLSIGTYNMVDARLGYHFLIGATLVIALRSPSPGAVPDQAGDPAKRRDVPTERGPHH